MTLEEMQALIDRGPYLHWLGLRVLSLEDDSIEVSATWREEWVASTRLMQTHGGILASLIDFAADFALVRRIGHGVPTIDLRIDYHRLAKEGDLHVRGEVIKHGRQFSTCEARITQDGKLIASGRGTYITAPLDAVSSTSGASA